MTTKIQEIKAAVKRRDHNRRAARNAKLASQLPPEIDADDDDEAEPMTGDGDELDFDAMDFEVDD